MQKEFTSRPMVPGPFTAPGIEFELPYPAAVTLRLLDSEGAELATIVDGKRYAEGTHQIGLGDFGKNVAFYQLSVNRDGVVLTDTKKIVMTI